MHHYYSVVANNKKRGYMIYEFADDAKVHPTNEFNKKKKKETYTSHAQLYE